MYFNSIENIRTKYGVAENLDEYWSDGIIFNFRIMVKREVERWEPAAVESAKNPIPLWGATSIKVKGSEAVGPIFDVKRENDFAANELKSDPLTTKKPEMGDKMIPYPCYPIADPKHGFTGVFQ